MIIEYDLTKTPFENAEIYYSKVKKLKQKLNNLIAQISKVEEELNKVEAEILFERKKLEKKRKKKWYEKFRWFFTSNDFLLIAGKDASTNEILIRKYLEKSDLVFHADIRGSPFGILKNGINANEIDIVEAAQFVASYSRAWKQKINAIEVYYVYPNQVSKKAPAGEYLPKGSFMIYGEKNFLHVELEVAIGVSPDGEVVPGVPSSVSKRTNKYVVLVPGDIKPSDIARKVSHMLSLDVDSVQKFVPGESDIKEISKALRSKQKY